MTITQTKTWDYDAVEVGQEAQPTITVVTPESVFRHATVVRSVNAAYHLTDVESDLGAAPLAMPTQIFSLAPKNRGGIAENNGMNVVTAHATPFAKCEGRWFAPIRVGDTVTSVARVLEKYERRGNKFVTVRLEPHNQLGEKLAEINHTSIFRFRQRDQKNAQQEQSSSSHDWKSNNSLEPSRLNETTSDEIVATATFESIAVGNSVYPLTIHSPLKPEVNGRPMSEEKAKAQSSEHHHEPGKFPWGALHGVGGITIIGFIDQMLDRWAPGSTLYGGGRLLFKAIKNFRPGDTVTYRGTVTQKRRQGSTRLVDFDVVGVNQLGRLTGVAEATLVFL